MDDVKKPYKMYAAMISAALISTLTTWADAPVAFVVIVTALISGLAVFITPNPKV